MKRFFDLVISSVLLFLLTPFLILISILVVIDNGWPIIFYSERVGINGKIFMMPKFRTMYVGTEIIETNKLKNSNKKITKIGKILRRFSIDELPQFINVFRGEMSLVGPRPYLAEHDYLFESNFKAYRVRQFVKPGVTGPAQCRGLRGEFTDPELVSKRIEMDFNYVGNWSLWLDVEIVIRTIGQVVFPPKSAY